MVNDLVSVFELDLQRFGLPLHSTREFLRAVSIVSLPKAPEVIEGIIDVRGEVLPVLDIRKRFGLPEKPLHPRDHFVVGIAGHRNVALRVDRLNGLYDIPKTAITDSSAISSRVEHISGVARLADGLILIHDLDTFLSRSESADLDRALQNKQ
ncbi:MAG: chemotaxis protein CheW [Woeseia sp.]